MRNKIIIAVMAIVIMAALVSAPSITKASLLGDNNDLGRLFILSRLFGNGNGVFNGSGGSVFGQGNIDLGNLIILSRLFNNTDIFGDETEPVAVQPTAGTQAAAPRPAVRDVSREVSGRILLQVEDEGQGWYVNPTDRKRYSLGDPDDAFVRMRDSALGISNEDFENLGSQAPSNLAGRFLIKAEDNGELYYVNPANRSLTYVGGPSDALDLMGSSGLGISNSDLQKIPAN